MARWERWTALALLGLAFLLRLFYAAHYRIDSDEPQHLHVVWGWTQGLLPYRDYFDNHMPLFQAACAPLMAWLGPRADIIVPMRIALFPIFFGTVWVVGHLGATLVSPRAGWWAGVLLAWCPAFYLNSIEFRPDQLWTLCWMGALLVLAGGEWSVRRAWWGGLLLGVAFSVSLKSSLMMGALVCAGLAVLVAGRPNWRVALPSVLALAAGTLVLPALITLYFVSRGAGPAFYQGVIGHNLIAGGHASHHLPRIVLGWGRVEALALCAALGLAWLLPPGRERWAVFFLGVAAASYGTLLEWFWPILTAEDFIPLYPAAFAAVAPVLLGAGGRWPAARVLPVLAVLAEIGFLQVQHPFSRDETQDKIGIVADALRLTSPGDFVMDSKGETITTRAPLSSCSRGSRPKGCAAG